LKTLKQLAELVEGNVTGDESTAINGVGSIFQGASNGSITFIEQEGLLAEAEKTSAAAVIVPPGVNSSTKPLLTVKEPKTAFARIAALFVENTLFSGEVSPKAYIHDSVSMGSNVSIHPFAVISENSSLGNETIIGPGVFIGKNVKIGDGCRVHANAVIEDNTVIGGNVVIHSGSVIGSDGFGFISSREGQIKVPQLGNVIIEDNVEIFANVTIDRGTIGSTIIGKGSKLGDDVHVGHNVTIGQNCILVTQTAIGGSSILGNSVTIAGKVGVTDHVRIGNNAVLASCTMAMKDVKDGSFLSGHPAMDHNKEYRIKAASKKLPDLLKKVALLEKKIAELEKRLGK
jgi:UDP-3-O-[3-hydroxymyristoyl] glucosamine N-acyltransferase